MELNELRVFLPVARERSFSRAALKLHRTQPAISQSIRRIENSLGERLFDRTTKDATLTEAGHLLRVVSRQVLRNLTNPVVFSQFRAINKERSGIF